MGLFLGFDGGGTKTECVALDENARFVASSKSGASNPTRIGFDAAAKAVEDAADAALRQVSASRNEIVALCAGLAGTGRPESRDQMLALLTRAFPRTRVNVITDLDLALAASPSGPAIVLVAGTGSAAIGRDAQGNISRTGGLGRDVSDEGSAYAIGRLAIESAANESAHAAAESSLGRQILRQLGCRDWPEVQQKISADRDAVFPRVFPVVAAAADAGDEFARSLLTNAAQALSDLVKTLASDLHLDTTKFHLAKTGGMIGRSSFFDDALAKNLAEAVPFAQKTNLLHSSAETAARIALESLQQKGSAS